MDAENLLGQALSTRSPGTRLAYLARVRQLGTRCRADLAIEPGTRITSADLVRWLIARKSAWAPATWRVYKAAVAALLDERMAEQEARRHAHPEDEARAEAAIARLAGLREVLQRETQADCKTATRQTSGAKAKRLSPVDRAAIMDALTRGRARHAGPLVNYLVAGVRTGLRPCEWPSAVLLPCSDPGVLVLRVANAKADALRAHGPHRTLRFVALPEADRAAIVRWMRITAACEPAAYDELLGRLSDLLYRTTRPLWPRRTMHPTLYSVRHEFSAVAKRAYERAEVAALMGHATDLTASTHYGRSRAGVGQEAPDLSEAIACLPRPDPDEVVRVRRFFADRIARMPAAQPNRRR